MRRQYTLLTAETHPRVYVRITDNWIELSVRFIVKATGSRDIKDKMSREIMAALEKERIGIASGTYQIVGLPPVRVEYVREKEDTPK